MKFLLLVLLLCLLASLVYADSDYFNRPDNVDLGPQWTPIANRLPANLVGGQIRSSGLTSGIEEAYIAIQGTDQITSVTLAAFNGSGYGDAGALVRVTDPAVRGFVGCIALKNDLTWTTYIEQRIAGGAPSILNSENSTAWTDGDVISLWAGGSDFSCQRNGIEVLHADDNSIAYGYPGIRIREDAVLNQTVLDDFFTTLYSVAAGTAVSRVIVP